MPKLGEYNFFRLTTNMAPNLKRNRQPTPKDVLRNLVFLCTWSKIIIVIAAEFLNVSAIAVELSNNPEEASVTTIPITERALNCSGTHALNY